MTRDEAIAYAVTVLAGLAGRGDQNALSALAALATPAEPAGPSKGALRQRKLAAKKKAVADAPPDVIPDVRADAVLTSGPRARSDQDLSQDLDLSEEDQNQSEISETARAIAGLPRSDVTADARSVARETVRQRIERERPGVAIVLVYQRLSEQVAAATGARGYDVQGHLQHWGWISAQPAAEWDLVLACIAADPWCRENPARVDPAHLRKKWPAYSAPPKPSVAAAAVPRAERVRGLQARLLTARKLKRAARTEAERIDAGLAESALERELVSLAGPAALELDDEAAA